MAKVNNRDFLKKVRKLTKEKLLPAYSAAMTELVLKVQGDAMRLTPVDSGNLRSSFRNIIGKPSAAGIEGTVYNLAEYALYVHEIEKNRHEVGEAKFLEKAVNKNRANADVILSRRIRKAISKK